MQRSLPLLAGLALAFLGLCPPAEAQFGAPFQISGDSLRGKITEAGDIDADGDQDVVIGDASDG